MWFPWARQSLQMRALHFFSTSGPSGPFRPLSPLRPLSPFPWAVVDPIPLNMLQFQPLQPISNPEDFPWRILPIRATIPWACYSFR